MRTSGFVLDSIGLVANNKLLSEKTIMVTPIEKLTMLDGELVSVPIDQETSGVDASGKNYSAKVTMDNAVEATWISMGSNRKTAPDVRRGERVLIYTFGDTNKYYWTTTGLDEKLRKLETVRFQISATADEAADSEAPENSYYVEISSHTKTITLRTSMANGEYCMYAFQFNMAEGYVLLTDELGNEFEFDSKNTNLRMKNADGTFLELNKKIIDMYAPDKIHGKAVNKIHLETKDVVVDCTNLTVNSQKNDFNTPTTNFNGNVNVSQTLTATTDVIGGGKSLKGHRHTNVQSGSGVSGPPQ